MLLLAVITPEFYNSRHCHLKFIAAFIYANLGATAGLVMSARVVRVYTKTGIARRRAVLILIFFSRASDKSGLDTNNKFFVLYII